MSPGEFDSYVGAFPGQYREHYAVARALIYEEFETAEDCIKPYNQLVVLLLNTAMVLGFKDSLPQALLRELATHASVLEHAEDSLRFATMSQIVHFRTLGLAVSHPRDYWSSTYARFIEPEVRDYYIKNGESLDQWASDSWEPHPTLRDRA